jgi:hypothetical protein
LEIILKPGKNSGNFWSSVEKFHLPVYFIRGPLIIGIQESQKFQPALFESPVSGGSHPCVWLRKQPDSRKTPDNIRTVVIGTVIHHDHFTGHPTLGED